MGKYSVKLLDLVKVRSTEAKALAASVIVLVYIIDGILHLLLINSIVLQSLLLLVGSM